MKLVEEHGIHELEVSWWWRRIRIVKQVTEPAWSPPPKSHELSATESLPVKSEVRREEPTLIDVDGFYPIRSPIVGTFYRSPAPDTPPYVHEGDTVDVGQVVGIVEAMKIMNEIESDVRGEIVQILVENAHPVEYNQILFMVKLL
jgi:acetyl-CoA carboxylase biotin carboxyl carrier protein